MDYRTYLGEAFAVGERAPVALIDPAASARMAVGEAITNIAAALDCDIGEIKLSPTGWRRPGTLARTRRCSTLYIGRHGVMPPVGNQHSGGEGFHVDEDCLGAGVRP